MEVDILKYVEKLLFILRSPSLSMPPRDEKYSQTAFKCIRNTYEEIALDPTLGFKIVTDSADPTLHKAIDGADSEIKFRCDAGNLVVIKEKIYSKDICETALPICDKKSDHYLRAQEQQDIRFWEHVETIITAHAEIVM